MDRITEKTWDLAEAKWKPLAAGVPMDVVRNIPELIDLSYGCSFCNLFPNECDDCPLGSNAGDCCGDFYMAWHVDPTPQNAARVLEFIQERRREWERENKPESQTEGYVDVIRRTSGTQ